MWKIILTVLDNQSCPESPSSTYLDLASIGSLQELILMSLSYKREDSFHLRRAGLFQLAKKKVFQVHPTTTLPQSLRKSLFCLTHLKSGLLDLIIIYLLSHTIYNAELQAYDPLRKSRSCQESRATC